MPRSATPGTAPPAAPDDAFREIVLPRQAGSHGDVLAAVGLADFLFNATGGEGVRLEQRDTSFAVVLQRPRRPSELAAVPVDPGYRYLQSKSANALPASVMRDDAVDYQVERDRINEFRKRESEVRKALAAARTDAQKQAIREEIDALGQQWPATVSRQAWRRYPPFLMLQGHETANKLFADLVTPDQEAQVQETIRAALAALAQGQPSGAVWKLSTVQVFSPNAAKGYARLKPDSTSRGDKTKDAWADPFLEWMRYRGYFYATIPVFHGSQGEHIRILAPVPRDISLVAYRAVVAEIPTPPRGASAAKIDIVTTLTIASLLIEHSDMHQRARDESSADDELEIKDRAPGDLIGGLAVTNYQSLGSARAVSALSEPAVPGWFKVHEPLDAVLWLDILTEHRTIIRSLADDHSDELTLLLTYRRFLERRGDDEGHETALDALLDFAGAYGGHVIRAREAGRPVRQFRADLFRKVVESMSTMYGPILDDEGFKAVAAAIRRATVSAQSRKARREEYREIRYGLLPDLRRASQLDDKNALVIAVSEFVDVYNAENARREEATGRAWHARVSTEQLAAFVRLLDGTAGANVIGALLCAYGTCREPREPATAEPDVAAGNDESSPGDELEAPEGADSTDEE